MTSFIPWVGGKRYDRFIDVFGGSGTVTMSRPIRNGCLEVYNDFNGDLVNLFHCVKGKTMALLLELGFLPLNSRDEFNILYKFFSKEEFTDDDLPTFGGVAVCEVPEMNKLMHHLTRNGYEHHVALVQSACADILEEALGNYLGWDVYRHS